jgi:uncharacterized protein (DUF2236 family)
MQNGMAEVAERQAAPAAAKKPMPRIDFLNPSGAPALYPPDSLAWQVFKNPVSLFAGGIAAVLLELAEPRVRSGVWGHSIFPTDPLTRIRRTGAATHATVYAPAETATRLIRSVNRMHDRVGGTTPEGMQYRANDQVLLDWVQATVGFGFMEAYATYVRPFTDAERDRFYAEGEPVARLFGAVGAPRSLAQQRVAFEAMRPHLVDHPIVHEFLDIMKRVPALPLFMRPLQTMMLRAGVDMLPEWVQQRLNLGPEWKLKSWERRLLVRLGRFFDRLPIPGTPPVQACQRLGLPTNYLYRSRTTVS